MISNESLYFSLSIDIGCTGICIVFYKMLILNLFFHFKFFNQNISHNIQFTHIKLFTYHQNILMEVIVSQIFHLRICLDFMSKNRKLVIFSTYFSRFHKIKAKA